MGLFDKNKNGAVDYSALQNKKMQGSEVLMERKAAEREAGKTVMDGRKLRATGRTEQVNTRFKPGFKDRIYKIALDENIPMAEVLEQGVELLELKLRIKD